MQIFAIFGIGDVPRVRAAIEQEYPKNHIPVDATSFLVAASGLTTQQVAESILGSSEPDAQRTSGVVVAFGGYYGFFNPNLWEWISVKVAANG